MSDMTYKYRPGAIIEGIENIRTAHTNIDRELDELEAYATRELANWQAVEGSKAEYEAHKAAWDAAVNEMGRIMIDDAIPALNKVLEGYNATERANVGMWAQG